MSHGCWHVAHHKRVEPAVAPQGRTVEDAFKSDLQVLQEQFAKAPAPVSTPQPLRDHHATCDTIIIFIRGQDEAIEDDEDGAANESPKAQAWRGRRAQARARRHGEIRERMHTARV